MWQWQAALPRPSGHDCLMAAPSRPSAARRFSSVISERPAAMRSAASGSPARGGVCSRRRSGACRSRSPPTACQPKKGFTRSRTTPERCWISIAVGPSTRSTRVPGSGVWPPAPRDHWIFSGSEWAAISAPTMSAQRVTSSLEAKPCLANASVSVLCRRSASGRGNDLPGLFMLQGSATSIGHDSRGGVEATNARYAAPGPPRRDSRRGFLGLVQPPSPQASLARAARRAARSLSRLALRDHAAANHRKGGRALFRALYRALAERARARGGAARGRAQAVGWARLLRARASFARLRQGGGGAPWRRLSAAPSGARRAARHRPLHCGGDRRDRI